MIVFGQKAPVADDRVPPAPFLHVWDHRMELFLELPQSGVASSFLSSGGLFRTGRPGSLCYCATRAMTLILEPSTIVLSSVRTSSENASPSSRSKR